MPDAIGGGVVQEGLHLQPVLEAAGHVKRRHTTLDLEQTHTKNEKRKKHDQSLFMPRGFEGRKSCSTGRRAWLTDWLRTGRLSLWWGILSNKRFGCDNVRRLLARESWQGHMGELSTCHVKKSPSCVISWFCVQRGVMEKGGTGFLGGWAGWRDSFSDKWQCPENILLTEHWMHAPTFCRQIEQTRFHRLCWEKQTNKRTNKQDYIRHFVHHSTVSSQFNITILARAHSTDIHFSAAKLPRLWEQLLLKMTN